MHKSTPRFTPHRAKIIIYVSDITIFVIEFYFLFRHKCQSLCHHKKFQFRFDLNFLIPIVQTFSSIKCHIKGRIKGQYINKELKLCLQNRALDIIEKSYLRIDILFKHKKFSRYMIFPMFINRKNTPDIHCRFIYEQ